MRCVAGGAAELSAAAEIGARELGLKVTDRVNMKMVGVPESSFEVWARKLLENGHKIVRVDQVRVR
jgi:DNA mismatch repair protein MSH6